MLSELARGLNGESFFEITFDFLVPVYKYIVRFYTG
jgi:hypothetical protein